MLRTYPDFDNRILSFFQSITNGAKRIKISRTFLINFFLIVLFSAQIAQIVFAYLLEKNIFHVFLLTLPTWLVIWYFWRVIKQSKKIPVWMDIARMIALLFGLIVLSIFLAVRIPVMIYFPNWYKFLYDIGYVVAGILFPCVLFFISCVDEEVTETKTLKENF